MSHPARRSVLVGLRTFAGLRDIKRGGRTDTMLEKRLRRRTPSGLDRSRDRRPGAPASQTPRCSGSGGQKAPPPRHACPRSPPPPQPRPHRSPGRVALLALGCPSGLVRNTRLSSVARRGDSFSQGHGPESIRLHLLLAWPLSLRLRQGSVAQWHLVDLLGKPGDPRVPLACPWRPGPSKWPSALLQPSARCFSSEGGDLGLPGTGSLPAG